KNISIAVQNVYEKAVDLFTQLENVANDEDVTTRMQCYEETQKKWLERVDANLQILSDALSHQRIQIGYEEFPIKNMTHTFRVFPASGSFGG
ncbi:MAG: hypothetical protein LBJ89_02005, partial [Holosporales bacterium]|nr:hypothetical protein [Holosporales bacterium]